MFGILYSVIMSIGGLGHNIAKNIEASERKDKAKNSYDHTYYDKKGKRILIDNNKWVCSAIRNGDRVLEDVKTRQVYRNFSEEQRERSEIERKQEAIKNNKTVYLYQYNKDVPHSDLWKGDRYKDIKTGEIYVIRKRHVDLYHGIGEVLLYLNISTGKFVRKADEQIERDKKWINKLKNIDNDAIDYVNTMYKRKNLSKEEFDLLVCKKREKIINTIKNNYINDIDINEYLINVNKKQDEYLKDEKYKNLYYA